MHDSSLDRNAVEVLAEEFIARYRKGDRPPLSEYTQRYPELAEEIQDLFPALLLIENIKPADEDEAAVDKNRAVKLDHLGDYRIIREVGRGGMGIVYEAEQVSLGRHVALKVLPQQSLLDARHKQRFEREARAAASLHHTNIVPVFGVGEQEGLSYYVMQFIQGLGIDAVLDELKRLKASDKAASNLASADEELRVSRRHDLSAADVARSLIEGSFSLRSPSGPATGALTAVPPLDSAIACETGQQRQDSDPRTAALTESGSLWTSTRCDTATGKLSDTFSLSGPGVVPGRQSASEMDTPQHTQTYWQSVAQIGMQVASALQYAHDQGILHRDIKPGNLLLDLRGTVWVTDFGLAKSNDQPDITHTGDVMGTLRYMPPEAFEGQMDSRSDVYSLGLTLYEMLALKPAFDESDRRKLIRQVTTADPPRLEKLNPKIPRDLVTIIHKAIDRDSLRRYQTALDLQVDLARFVADEPVQARPLTLRERGWRWCRHNRAVAVLSSVLILALLAVTVASTFAYFQESAHRQEIENKKFEISQALTAERAAKDQATGRLYRSLVLQARANRLSRRMGQRLESLEVLAEATRMAREMSLSDEDFLELRNEAIACVTLPDVKMGREWSGWPIGTRGIDMSAAFDRYARTDREGMVSLRRTADDSEICSFPGLGPGDSWPLFSPDGRFLLVWNLTRGAMKVWRLDGPEPCLLVDEESSTYPAFCPDSRRLACRNAGDSILIVDLVSTGLESTGLESTGLESTGLESTGLESTGLESTGLESTGPESTGPDSPRPNSTGRRHKFPVGNHAGYIAWHPAGRLLAIAAPQGVQIRDTETGDLSCDLPHPAWTDFVAWHPDGRTLAAVGSDSVIQIWDVASRKQTVQLKGHTNSGIHFTFSHDGQLLASNGWDQTLRLWDPRTGEQVFQTRMIMDSLRLSADDGLLAANVSETAQQLSLVELFRACGYRTLVRDPVLGRGSYYVASTSPDSRLLAVGENDGVALWDLVRGEPLTFLPCGSNRAVLFEAGGSLLTSGPAGVVRRPIDVDASNSGTVRLRVPQLLPLTGTSPRIATNRDGSVVAQALLSGGLVWHQDLAIPRQHLGPHYDARYIAVSPDGRQVATGSHSGAGVRIWDASTGELVHELAAIGRANVEFSRDGRWLAATGGRLWETNSWTEVRRLEQCLALAFSPDSKVLAMETGKGIVRLVDPESGREYAKLEDPHQDVSRDLCFSHDGSQLVATDTDSSTIHVWDLRLIRQELREMELDWDLPPDAPSGTPRDARPLVAIEEQSAGQGVTAVPVTPVAASAEAAATTATYRQAFESVPGEASYGRGWATLALDSGDAAVYRRACEILRDRFGKSANMYSALQVCWTFLLSDDSVPDKRFLLDLGTSLVNDSANAPWAHTAVAGAQLRNGEHEAALRSLDESDRLGRGWHAHVTNDFLRAIALARLERAGEARSAFDQGVAYADAHLARTPAAPFGEMPASGALDWYAIRVLRREAAALLHDAGSDEKATNSPAPAAKPKPPVPDKQVPDKQAPGNQAPDEQAPGEQNSPPVDAAPDVPDDATSSNPVRSEGCASQTGLAAPSLHFSVSGASRRTRLFECLAVDSPQRLELLDPPKAWV